MLINVCSEWSYACIIDEVSSVLHTGDFLFLFVREELTFHPASVPFLLRVRWATFPVYIYFVWSLPAIITLSFVMNWLKPVLLNILFIKGINNYRIAMFLRPEWHWGFIWPQIY